MCSTLPCYCVASAPPIIAFSHLPSRRPPHQQVMGPPPSLGPSFFFPSHSQAVYRKVLKGGGGRWPNSRPTRGCCIQPLEQGGVGNGLLLDLPPSFFSPLPCESGWLCSSEEVQSRQGTHGRRRRRQGRFNPGGGRDYDAASKSFCSFSLIPCITTTTHPPPSFPASFSVPFPHSRKRGRPPPSFRPSVLFSLLRLPRYNRRRKWGMNWRRRIDSLVVPPPPSPGERKCFPQERGRRDGRRR